MFIQVTRLLSRQEYTKSTLYDQALSQLDGDHLKSAEVMFFSSPSGATYIGH